LFHHCCIIADRGQPEQGILGGQRIQRGAVIRADQVDLLDLTYEGFLAGPPRKTEIISFRFQRGPLLLEAERNPHLFHTWGWTGNGLGDPASANRFVVYGHGRLVGVPAVILLVWLMRS
jgi:hypothetical protein